MDLSSVPKLRVWGWFGFFSFFFFFFSFSSSFLGHSFITTVIVFLTSDPMLTPYYFILRTLVHARLCSLTLLIGSTTLRNHSQVGF